MVATGRTERAPVTEGCTARIIIGDEKNWEWYTVRVVNVRDDKALILFESGTRMTVDVSRLEVTDPTPRLVFDVPKFDPTRIPSHSETQFHAGISDAAYCMAIRNDDMMREHCE